MKPTASIASIKPGFRLDIQGARGLAVCAVIINHINSQWLARGYLGVDIFFVISGYVITKTIINDDKAGAVEKLRQFYKRRILRITPSLFVFTIITAICSAIVIPDPRVSLKTAIASLLGVSNIFLARESLNYFSSDTNFNPFTQTWSLGVEEQFYALYPILILLLSRNKKAKRLPWLSMVLTVLLLASLIQFLTVDWSANPEAYLQTHVRAWELLAGCISYLSQKKIMGIKDKYMRIPGVALLGLLLCNLSINSIQDKVAIAGCVACTALLLTTNEPADKAYKLLSSKPLVHLGTISYSLYLWHWGIISLSRWTVGIHAWTLPLQLTTIYIISSISYKLIEKPFIETQRIADPNKIFKLWSASTGIIVLILSLLGYKNKGFLFIGEKNREGKVYSEEKLWSPLLCMNPTGEDISNTALEKCWIKRNPIQALTSQKPRPIQQNKIFAIGNSYNEMMVPAYATILSQSYEVRGFHAYVEAGCLTSTKLSRRGQLKECSRLTKQYFEWFEKNSSPGDTLIISNYIANFHPQSEEVKFTYKGINITNLEAFNIYTNELQEIGKKLKKSGKALIVISGIPIISQPLDVCVNWYAHLNNDCQIVIDEKRSAMAMEMNARLKSKLLGHAAYADIYHVIEQLIKNDKNSIYQIYMNQDHISKPGSLKTLGSLKSALLDARQIP